MKYSRDLFGSTLSISSKSKIPENVITSCFALGNEFESKYSRFISWNILDTLNTQKTLKGNKELISIIQLSLRLSEMSNGYFDITILPMLENLWYGKCKEKVEESIGYENIIIEWDTITLKNNVNIDIWSVWKGYMVDTIYNIVEKYVPELIVDFGWDIRIKWKNKVGLEDPNSTKKLIGSIEIEDLAIASSAGNKRIFWNHHHLMNPKERQSENNKIGVYVTHKLASFADGFSTALFVTPLDISIDILNKVSGLEWLIIANDGSIYQSKWFNSLLHTVW